MGQRHNRKRIRSRPRNRNRNRNRASNISVTSATPPPVAFPLYGLPSLSYPIGYWPNQYAAWQDGWGNRQQHQQQQQNYEDELEAQRLRIFGGEAGDEVSLCEPMLRVVMDLFDGLDYVDP